MRKTAKKHGFTLVEMVVVMTIIGVLAAILVPTLIGAVMDSRITSGNQTAKSVKDRANEFFTMMSADNTGYTGGTKTVKLRVENGKWTLNGAGGASDWQDGVNHWSSVEYVKPPDNAPNKDTEFLSYIADSLSGMGTSYIDIHIESGFVIGVAVVMDSAEAASEMPSADNFKSGKFGFDGSGKAGVENGTVVGTCPVLTLP